MSDLLFIGLLLAFGILDAICYSIAVNKYGSMINKYGFIALIPASGFLFLIKHSVTK